MPDLDTAQSAQLQERRGTNAHVLIWITAKDRTTGLPETIGFWTGDDHQEFVIGGETRLYFGAGEVIDVPPVKAGTGLAVLQHRITLGALTDEARQLIRGYDARQAGVEVHCQPMDIDTGQPLGAPIRMIKGTLNKAPETIGPKGGTSNLVLTVVTTARKLTFGLPLLRSDAELRRRNPNDRGREYADVAGDWVVPWGE
ncbi:hypothetical protein QO034_06600 [Sedimentitalea sp. JM2-8]|uniref:Bacteriophage phiJL001 Gp84 N-terminal domain-containing protein n=1 Tax=Sedimentitalea xiamensis TaxID=3050037 RepID=A0ABT7FCC7_9RHOB|nr:hypothetical protein [Sedimentitalea xiamensis]MDK3072774.1 hypothetical protein [Sedimentitalea xiamensis]